jgi:3-methyladenine DNA glycosylase AlkD
VGAVRAALATAGDPERAIAQQAYMKSAMPYRGITAPELKRVLRPVLTDPALVPRTREAWETSVRALWDEAAYREERYAAIALTRHRVARPWQDVDTLGLYRHLVVTGAWWDLVDPVAGERVGAVLLTHRREATPVLRGWATAEDLWLRRSAILAQLGHRGATDTGFLEEVLDANLEDSLHGREFFVRKAVGWALRQYARTDPDWVRRYVTCRGDRLAGLSRREALKHL